MQAREERVLWLGSVFGMNQSLDGYVDHTAFARAPLFRHFIAEAQGQAGSVYGRQMYEVMRYWDDDRPDSDRGTCLRGSMAEPAEMGRLALVAVGRPKREAC